MKASKHHEVELRKNELEADLFGGAQINVDTFGQEDEDLVKTHNQQIFFEDRTGECTGWRRRQDVPLSPPRGRPEGIISGSFFDFMYNKEQ